MSNNPAAEIANALRVMQNVLVKQESHVKKRDKKHQKKQDPAGSLVDQIFAPTGGFKGVTPVVAIDCEMI